MRNLLIVGLLLASPAIAGPPNQWATTDKAMADYLADGYTVVGFQVMPVENRIMPLTAYRYLLQKGPSVVLCSEKVNNSDVALLTSCYELR